MPKPTYSMTNLVDAIAEDCRVTKADARRVLASAFDHIIKATNQGDNVTLHQFGTFKVSHRMAKSGRNPQTCATIEVPAKNVLTFKASKALRDL